VRESGLVGRGDGGGGRGAGLLGSGGGAGHRGDRDLGWRRERPPGLGPLLLPPFSLGARRGGRRAGAQAPGEFFFRDLLHACLSEFASRNFHLSGSPSAWVPPPRGGVGLGPGEGGGERGGRGVVVGHVSREVWDPGGGGRGKLL
jgi:hypothetical protein